MNPNSWRRLVTRQNDRVLTVTFNNPPRHFFDERMSLEFDQLTRLLAKDRTVGAVVFTGADNTFITHFDVPDLLRGARSVPVPVPYPVARASINGSSMGDGQPTPRPCAP